MQHYVVHGGLFGVAEGSYQPARLAMLEFPKHGLKNTEGFCHLSQLTGEERAEGRWRRGIGVRKYVSKVA